MPLFARPRFAFIIGWASFCKYGYEPSGFWIRGSLQSCWRIFTEEGYGIMPARGRGETAPAEVPRLQGSGFLATVSSPYGLG